MGGRSCGDILLVPYWLPGHINPMMYAVRELMRRGGLTATMLLQSNDAGLMKAHVEGEGMEGFRLVLVDEVDTDQPKDPLKTQYDVGRACEPFLEQVLAEQQAGGEGPKCMIVDQFMAWTESWAPKLQVPRYVLISSPVAYAYCLYNYSSLMKRDRILEREAEDPVLDLPGIPTIRLDDLPCELDPPFNCVHGDTLDKAAGLLFNSFYDLEPSTIDAFDAQLQAKDGEKRTKMIPIGPMLPAEFFTEETFTSTTKEHECIQWLNTRPQGSVVYIVFGTQVFLSKAQIRELANGVEASGVSFLLVLRAFSKSGDISPLLPPGFQQRTRDRGFVYSRLAPQLQVLSNPAVGGILSHCGWNSSLESVCRGVPIIGWPFEAEQRVCCRVLERAGVAVPIRPQLTRWKDLVRSDEVEKALRLLMVESEGKKLKARATEFQRLVKDAFSPGGSSIENLKTLLQEIRGKSSGTQQNHH